MCWWDFIYGNTWLSSQPKVTHWICISIIIQWGKKFSSFSGLKFWSPPWGSVGGHQLFDVKWDNPTCDTSCRAVSLVPTLAWCSNHLRSLSNIPIETSQICGITHFLTSHICDIILCAPSSKWWFLPGVTKQMIVSQYERRGPQKL